MILYSHTEESFFGENSWLIWDQQSTPPTPARKSAYNEQGILFFIKDPKIHGQKKVSILNA